MKQKLKRYWRLALLVALFFSAPIALGWAILLLMVLTTYQHWRGTMSQDRPGMIVLTGIVAAIGCAFSAYWCGLVGWLVVSGILVATLLWKPLIPLPDSLKKSARMQTIPDDYADDAIDVEWWDCSTPYTEHVEQELMESYQIQPSDAR